jgi:hypothetical protein
VLNPGVLQYAVIYFLVPMIVMTLTTNQVRVMKIVLHFVSQTTWMKKMVPSIQKQIILSRQFTVAFFTKTDQIHMLNKAILYIHNNERCDRIKIIHVYEEEAGIPPQLTENHYILDHVFPKIQIDLVRYNYIGYCIGYYRKFDDVGCYRLVIEYPIQYQRL